MTPELHAKITKAVSMLELANDNHWTQEGLPRVETIRLLAADPSITRELVTAALPDVTRASLQAGAQATAAAAAAVAVAAAGGEQGTATAEQAPQGAPTQPSAPTVVLATVEETAAPLGQGAQLQGFLPEDSGEETLAERLEEARERMAEFQVMKAQLDAAMAELSVHLDDLITQHEKHEKENGEDPIRAYLNSRSAAYAQRAERQKQILESGLNLTAIAKLANPKSPLDTKLNTRGRQG